MSSTLSGSSEVFQVALPLCWTSEASRSPAFDLRGMILLDLHRMLSYCKRLPFRSISWRKAGFRTFAIQRVSTSACTRANFQRAATVTVKNWSFLSLRFGHLLDSEKKIPSLPRNLMSSRSPQAKQETVGVWGSCTSLSVLLASILYLFRRTDQGVD